MERALRRSIADALRPTERFIVVFMHLCVAAVLVAAYGRFASSYFWLDDFNNLALARHRGVAELLRDVLNPASEEYRPIGLLTYRILERTAGLDALAYHCAAWAFHTANVYLVYRLLARLVGSRYAAAWGALLFAFEAVYIEIFHCFCVIFEVEAGFFLFLGLMLFLRVRAMAIRMVALPALYLVAVKSKEMAITLPAVLLLCDLMREGLPASAGALRSRALQVAGWLLPMALLGVWLAIVLLGWEASPDPAGHYYVDLSPSTLLASYAWYIDALLGNPVGPLPWIVAAIVVGCMAMLLRREGPAATFFVGYIAVTLLPAIVIPNHLTAMFWYIPFFGLCGLFALAVEQITSWCRARVPVPQALGVVLFAVGCWGHFRIQAERTAGIPGWVHGVGSEFRAFVEGLRGLPPPAPGETVYFETIPQYHNDGTVRSAARIVIRMDLDIQVVTRFPPESRYRVRFENPFLILEPRPGPD